MAKERLSTVAVSPELAIVIEKLLVALRREFDTDYAFTIAGSGRVIAASNDVLGLVTPQVKV